MEGLNDTRIGGVVTEAFAVRASASTSATLHVKHGTAIFVGLEADVFVEDEGRGLKRGRVLVVPPHEVHGLRSNGPALGLLFDPELEPRVAAFARARGGAFVLERALAERILGAGNAHRASLANADVLAGIGREVARIAGEGAAPKRIDRRVARALEALRANDDDRSLLASTSISPAHLRDLFARDVGVSMRTYRLWWRLLRAVTLASRSDWTTAAHAAGFSDLAHLSRTCRRMLGYSPTVLRAGPLARRGRSA